MNMPENKELKEFTDTNENENFYSIPETLKLKGFLTLIDEIKKEIDSLKPINQEIWATVQDKIMIDWTYNTNAIEGCTLTRGETSFFLQYGLTVKGKPLKDFLDTRNHADAIEFLFEVIKNERPLGTSLLKEFNSLLLSGVTYTKAVNQFGEPVKKTAHPGEYKKEPNHVLQADGTIHYYAEPIQVPFEMENLCNWMNRNIDSVHPVISAAIAHYNFVRIHPFDDGNGRGARLLMNTILMNKKYPPVVIKNENRQDYIEGLVEADNGNIALFTEFVAQSLIDTQEIILNELKNAGKNIKKKE